MWKIIAFILAVLAVAGGVFYFVEVRNRQEAMKSLNISSVISSARELTTLKYEYTDFGVYEEDTADIPLLGKVGIPLTKNEFIFTYGGTICVGFQLKDVIPQVDVENKIITIEVPEPIVLSHTPNHDSDGVYVIKNSILTSSQEEITSYEDAKEQLRKEKEETLMKDKSIKENAVKEYKEMCEAWLLGADANVSEYQIQYIESK